MAAKPIPDSVTVTITSCGRLDLLDQTLTAFQSFNSGGRYLINEDSGDAQVIEAVKKRMPEATVLTGEGRTGLIQGFMSKRGAPFAAYLVLSKTGGKAEFEFPPR